MYDFHNAVEEPQAEIAHKLISTALACGYSISVNNDCGKQVYQSRKQREIERACFHTKETVLIMHQTKPDKHGDVYSVGHITLLAWDDNQVIADWSINDKTDKLVIETLRSFNALVGIGIYFLPSTTGE